MNPPPYAPNVVNQTVDYGGVTWKGNPGGDWYPASGGGGLSGYQSPYEDPAYKAIYDATSDINQKYFAKVKDFDTKNPFIYDEVLKQEVGKVGQRLDPYYKQTLNDYLRGVSLRTSRSLEDQRNALTDLNADINSYSLENQNNLSNALEKSRQGYADVGNYFSGAQARDTATTGLDSNQTLQNYMTNQQSKERDINLNTSRALQDTNQDSQTYQRDVGHYDPISGQFMRGAQSEAEVRTQAIPQVEQRQQQRQFELSQYAGAPPGVAPGEFMLNSYNLLR